jgi:hypothetical protein
MSTAKLTFVRHIFTEDQVLAALTNTTDAEFLAAEFIRKPCGCAATLAASLACHTPSKARLCKQIDAECVIERIHCFHRLYTIQAPNASVNTYFKKNAELVCGHKGW